MGLLKDMDLYFSYSKTLKENRGEIKKKFGMRIDNASRLYTVLNIPEDLFEEPYNIRTGDIDTIAENYIKEFVKQLSEYLNSKGLAELYGFDREEPIKKVDKYSYLIVVSYKRLDSRKLLRNIYIASTIAVISIISTFFTFF